MSIDKINRILYDVDEMFEEVGLSMEEEISYYNSTSIDGSSLSEFEAKSALLEMRDENTMVVNHDNLGDTISHNTTQLHLEVVLEIDHDDFDGLELACNWVALDSCALTREDHLQGKRGHHLALWQQGASYILAVSLQA